MRYLELVKPPRQAQAYNSVSLHWRRYHSTDIENLKKQSDSTESDNSVLATGVIDKESNEVLLYYSFAGSQNLARQYLSRLVSPKITSDNLRKRVEKVSSPLPKDASITELVPLPRDSGAFVKFKYPPLVAAKDFLNEIRSNVIEYDNKRLDNIFKRVFNYVWNKSPQVYTVKGVPWIEDLKRFPSAKLGITYEGNPLTEEELYVLFRRYGLIDDIKVSANGGGGAAASYVFFHNVRSATCAKHCITGMELNHGETTIHIQYVPVKKTNFLVKMIMDHTKIALPIILALLATFAVLIFDPIRERFIQYKITHSGHILDQYRDSRLFKLFYVPYKKLTDAVSSSYDYIDNQLHEVAGVKVKNSGDDYDDTSDDGNSTSTMQERKLESNMLWQERFEKSKQLKLWIKENIDTFIIVKGPPGSGKEEFVFDHTLASDAKLKKRVLFLDCDEFSKARSENSLIGHVASQLGYFPVFTWTNTISQFVDLGVQGLTGQKSGLSESKETQLKNMFGLTTQAIRHITDTDYQRYVQSVEKRNRKLKDDEKIEVLKQEEFLTQFPESKPIIVINKFSRRADISSNDFIYPLIADWASGLIQNNIAHVIFSTADVGSLQHLTDALPNQVFKTISLSDASIASSKQYICDALKLNDTVALDRCIAPLGGRMLDLQAFIRRIKSGEHPPQAIEEMVTQAAELITTVFLQGHKFHNDDTVWNPSQVWLIMKLLSKSDAISYDSLVKSPLFKKSQQTLDTLTALEKYDLISLERDKGVLDKISTGRPLFKAAFENIVSDVRIWKLYETEYLTNLIAIEVAKLTKFENELTSIYKIGKINGKIDGRIDYLSRKIEGSNKNIEAYEKEIKEIASFNVERKHNSFLGIF
ncbi:YME2 [Candida oxycetoniae]|uniref:Mitochondrial escape protein 2 n=1 Tax=Candida oxycetoniae TaxID=497107 RepID=A0AAI9WXH6_9ASCO|nr:YME2 [Candida oxycetoniae]KAI3403775.2 YME2 [Candida oxycetoniae]